MAVHPELTLGYTPIIIILTVQILGELSRRPLTEGEIKDVVAEKIAGFIKGEREKRMVSVLAQYEN